MVAAVGCPRRFALDNDHSGGRRYIHSGKEPISESRVVAQMVNDERGLALLKTISD